MADEIRTTAMTEELRELLERARGYKMTPREVREQRVSFVYGMLPFDSKLTRADVRDFIAKQEGWEDER